ncbi:MAG: hypothetical protein AAB283_08330 [Planctomycetota bacterium]
MACLDYVSEDLRCLRGIPVTPRFSSFFCKEKHDRCPLVIWEKSQAKGQDMVRPKSLINIWRRP